MTAKHMLVLLFYCIAAWGQPQRSSLDYPLGLKTRWTYHLHHENGPGVHFGDTLAALAKDNVLDTTLISEAVGLDTVGAHSYTRVETRLNGKPWLFEWQRLSPEGLMIGKTIDYQQGDQAVIMQPEQKRISAELRPGNSWSWTAKDAPVRFRYAVAGPGQVDVPASHYQGINLNTNGTVDAPFGKVEIHQDTWFVPGVGIVRQETTTNVGERKLSHVVLTLEKFEHP